MQARVKAHHWLTAPLIFAFVFSLCSHGWVVLALLLGSLGRAGGGGENGVNGAGDTEVEVSLASPGDNAAPAPTQTTTSTTPEPPQPKPAKPTDEKSDEPSEPEAKSLPPLPQASRPTEIPPSAVPANGSDAVTNGGRSPGSGNPNAATAGIDGASVAGQRALLPRAARCDDPVAGRWEALKYSPARGDWVHFTLTVKHFDGGLVSGTIVSRTWAGSPLDREPPPCVPGGFDITVSMPAAGIVDSVGRITFGASRYTVVAMACPSPALYSPDRFSGSIDSSREEFQSLNNDGANDINVPYVFRRTSCL